MKPAKPVVEIVDFAGMMAAVDPRDLPNGASEEQINASCLIAGELTVRRGIQEVSFEE